MLLDVQQEKDFRYAVEALQQGRLIAFPTETVYGLGADGFNEEACRGIYRAKGRPSDNPLILHISDERELEGIVASVPEKARQLAKAFWPGPLTMVFERQGHVPDVVTGGLSTVAVRLPDSIIAQGLIRGVGHPLAAPSANLSGKPSPTLARHVEKDFGEAIAGVIDGGACRVGVESTIVDMTVEPPVILRPGGITKEDIEACIGPVAMAKGIKDDSVPKAPGMKYRHYAPEAPVYLVTGTNRGARLLQQLQTLGEREIGLLLADETINTLGILPTNVRCYNLGSFSRPADAAHRLFDGLRRMDAFGVEEIYIDAWEKVGIGDALMNRIEKLSQPWQEEDDR